MRNRADGGAPSASVTKAFTGVTWVTATTEAPA